MEQRTENNLVEVEAKLVGRSTQKEIDELEEYFKSVLLSKLVEEPKKSGKGNYERQARGSYTKHKLEKKANVRHFINKNVDTNKGWENHDDPFRIEGSLHPLYVQITFNRRTTTIKSAIVESLSIDDYAEISTNTRLLHLIAREKDFIEYHFQKTYKAYLDSLREHYTTMKYPSTLAEKDEINTQATESAENTFEFDNLIKGFSYYNFEIHKLIDIALKCEIIEFAEKLRSKIVKENRKQETIQNELLNLFNKSYTNTLYQSLHYDDNNYSPNALQLLSCLEMRNPEFKELRLMYPSEIWNFEVFYGFLRNNYNIHYCYLGATMVDYLKGDFKDIFLSEFDNDEQKAKLIFKDIEKLIKKKRL